MNEMNETFEQMVLRVGKEQYEDDFHKWPEEYTKRVIDFATRIRDELIPADMVLMPRELTYAMHKAGLDANGLNTAYKAMITAYEKEITK